MTDKEKLDKLVAEIERLYHQSLVDENRQAEWGLSSAACTSYGKSKVCKELLSFTDSMQKEPKECMYSKDNFTDEDRKVLCGGCEEDCRFNKKGYSASEDLEQAIDTYLATYFGSEKEKQDWPFLKKMAIHFANWQKKKDDYAIEIAHMAGEEEGKNIMKQQMMANAVDAVVKVDAGGYPYIPQMELYDYDKDIPLAKEGDKYKVILIKE